MARGNCDSPTCAKMIGDRDMDIEWLREQVRKLREALGFYRDYFDGKVPYLDKGERARKALAE